MEYGKLAAAAATTTSMFANEMMMMFMWLAQPTYIHKQKQEIKMILLLLIYKQFGRTTGWWTICKRAACVCLKIIF